MARIRTVKPEFWSSPGIESISPWARLLFIAMWNWADDAGRGTCQLRELQAFAFPYDEDAPEVATPAGFRSTLGEVRNQYGVLFYKVGGRPYYAIPSWKRHQRNERTAQSRHPGPDEGQEWDFLGPDLRSGGSSDNLRPTAAEAEKGAAEIGGSPAHVPDGSSEPRPPFFGVDNTDDPDHQSYDLGSGGASDIFRHGAAEAPQASGPGTGEQGNRGTGEQGSSAPTERGADAPTAPTAQTITGEWIDRCAKRPPKSVIGQVAKQVRQMLDDEIDADDIRRGIATWMTKGLHPSTLPSVVNEVMNRPVPHLRAVSGGTPRGGARHNISAFDENTEIDI